GGHTMEMFRLLRGVDLKMFSPRVYVCAATDKGSTDKVAEFEGDGELDWSIYRIPRVREVGQSFSSTTITFTKSLMASMSLLLKMSPDIILCNGPGTCVPICLLSYLLRVLLPFSSSPRIIYVESIARVSSLSLSGKILYWITDRFFVQWPQLTKTYPGAEFRGRMV
ncbi:oligosaccharide biosynthesis protein Alg14-like protein, partial [Phlyctochytrium arcticum]